MHPPILPIVQTYNQCSIMRHIKTITYHKLIANMSVPFISLKSYHLYQQIAVKGSPQPGNFQNSINANLEPCIWNHSKYTSILIISEVH